jgi:hypothetical protein
MELRGGGKGNGNDRTSAILNCRTYVQATDIRICIESC